MYYIYYIYYIAEKKMKKDLMRLVILAWMCVTIYFIYEMYVDLGYMSDIISAYIRMIVEHIRH